MLPTVTPTVPVVVPPVPMSTVFVVPAPGIPSPIVIATPPEVTAAPLPILIVCVAAFGEAFPMLIVFVPVD